MNNPALERWFKQVACSLLGEYESIISTFELCKTVIERGVPGDFVECGVFAGAECAAMAKAIMETEATGRKVHLFDSFRGMPRCGPEDLEFMTARKQPGEACCSLEGVQRNMRNWGIPDDLLVYHPGWFAETIPANTLRQIAYLRIDCDLYTSTRECLGPLYKKVPTGGWVCIDDYPLSGCRKAMHEVIAPQPIYFQNVIPADRYKK